MREIAGRAGRPRLARASLIARDSRRRRLRVAEAAARAAGDRAAPSERAERDTGRAEPARAGRLPRRGERAQLHAPRTATPSVVVLGGGPGGYTAAFRAADLGKEVVLVERHPTLGGVCLNVGCIPSKALLHVAEVINEARELAARGVDFGEPTLDLERIRAFKERTVATPHQGPGRAREAPQGDDPERKGALLGAPTRSPSRRPRARPRRSPSTTASSRSARARSSSPDSRATIRASGTRPTRSRLDEVPERLLVIGGGIIGLEMATVYDALGAKITVVELLDGLHAGDRPRPGGAPAQAHREPLREHLLLDARHAHRARGRAACASSSTAPTRPTRTSSTACSWPSAAGRTADAVAPEAAGLDVDEHGFIPVDARQRTNVPHIYAVGDVTGPPMLAHKATHEGKIAAEVIAGLPAAFDARAIPSVAYTDPEVAWAGLTEEQARQKGIAYEKAVFPWSASGRALGIGRPEGLTKLLIDPATHALLGAGMVGRNAGELIAEAVLALEMGADAEDLGLTIHPHPTLSETLAFAAEMVEGTITDLYAPKKR